MENQNTPVVEVTNEGIELEFERRLNQLRVSKLKSAPCRRKLSDAFEALEWCLKNGSLDSALRDEIYGAQVKMAKAYSDFQLRDDYYNERIERWNKYKSDSLGDVKHEWLEQLKSEHIPYKDISTIPELIRPKPTETSEMEVK